MDVTFQSCPNRRVRSKAWYFRRRSLYEIQKAPSSPNRWPTFCNHSGVHSLEPSPGQFLLASFSGRGNWQQKLTPRARPLPLSPWVLEKNETFAVYFDRFHDRVLGELASTKFSGGLGGNNIQACPSMIPFLSPQPRPQTPVEQPNRNCWLTFMSSSFQKYSLSSISVVNSPEVTPPVRSSMPSPV